MFLVGCGGKRRSTFISNLLLYRLGLHIFIFLKSTMVTYTKSNHHQKRRNNKSLFISQCSCHSRCINSILNSSILFFIRQSCSTFEKFVFIYKTHAIAASYIALASIFQIVLVLLFKPLFTRL